MKVVRCKHGEKTYIADEATAGIVALVHAYWRNGVIYEGAVSDELQAVVDAWMGGEVCAVEIEIEEPRGRYWPPAGSC
jgi:hypothetical protein